MRSINKLTPFPYLQEFQRNTQGVRVEVAAIAFLVFLNISQTLLQDLQNTLVLWRSWTEGIQGIGEVYRDLVSEKQVAVRDGVPIHSLSDERGDRPG